jgi:hypothetical protein
LWFQKRKPAVRAGFEIAERVRGLELFEEFAGRAGDVDSAGDAALAVLDALYDACGLGALGTIGALLGVHDLLAVTGFGDLCHCFVLPETKVWLDRFAWAMRRPALLVCICEAAYGLGRTGECEDGNRIKLKVDSTPLLVTAVSLFPLQKEGGGPGKTRTKRGLPIAFAEILRKRQVSRLRDFFFVVLAGEEGLDAAAEEEEDACDDRADVLNEQEARAWIDIAIGWTLDGEVQGYDAKKGNNIKFDSNAHGTSRMLATANR